LWPPKYGAGSLCCAAKGAEKRGRVVVTLDGNLVGDLAEALALSRFDLKLVEIKSHAAIDGFGLDGRSVHVKATGTGRGPAFRATFAASLSIAIGVDHEHDRPTA
jgi:hypothetical protein